MNPRITRIARFFFSLSVVALIGACAGTTTGSGGVERMYVLYCGGGNAPDTARWTPGVAANVGKPITLS